MQNRLRYKNTAYDRRIKIRCGIMRINTRNRHAMDSHTNPPIVSVMTTKLELHEIYYYCYVQCLYIWKFYDRPCMSGDSKGKAKKNTTNFIGRYLSKTDGKTNLTLLVSFFIRLALFWLTFCWDLPWRSSWCTYGSTCRLFKYLHLAMQKVTQALKELIH